MSSGAAFSLMNYHTGRVSGVNAAFINLLIDAGGAFNPGFVIIARDATLLDLGGVNISKRSNSKTGDYGP